MNWKIKFFFSVSLIFSCWFGWNLLFSPSPPLYTFDGTAMMMDYHILVDATQKDQQQIQEIINKTFQEVDQIYNKWNHESEISKINRLKANEIIEISLELEGFLALTDLMVELTQGRFDPTIEPLQQLWKDHLKIGTIPDSTSIAKILPAVGWKNLHYGNRKLFKDHDQTGLDLGGIAKGYCVDLLVERIHAAGHTNVFVEWGGEIRAHGKHPAQRPWRVFVSRFNDMDPKNAITQIDLETQAIATSGDYIQNWRLQQVTYFHIIDPHTAKPLESTLASVASATVIAPTCAQADALATAAMMHPSIQKAREWAGEIHAKDPNIKFWLVARDGSYFSLP